MALKKFKLHSKPRDDKNKKSWKSKAKAKDKSVEKQYKQFEKDCLRELY